MGLNVICWNAHSISNKFNELSILIDQLSIDIILISESWLSEDSIFNIQGFSSYRSDRFRGGTAIFIRSSIPHNGFSKIQFNYAECCTISIFIDSKPLKISSIYCSPSASRSQAKSFFEKVFSQPGPHVVGGDFNAKHIAWNNVSNDHKGVDLFDLFSHWNFKILPPSEPTLYPPTGCPSCVDFVVIKGCHFVDSIEVVNDLSSDHLPILFQLSGACSNSSVSLNLKKTNWIKFCKIVDRRCIDLERELILSTVSIDSIELEIQHSNQPLIS